MLRHYIARHGTFKSSTRSLKVSGKPDCKKFLLIPYCYHFYLYIQERGQQGLPACQILMEVSLWQPAQKIRDNTRSGEVYNPCQDSAPGRKALFASQAGTTVSIPVFLKCKFRD